MPELGDVFEFGDHIFEVAEILEEPNTGLVVIVEIRGVDSYKFTLPGVILDELVRLSRCQVCGLDKEIGLKACATCYESAKRKSRNTPGIDELAKRNVELQGQLEQMTERRADAIGIIEEQREAIRVLKAQ